MKVSKHVDFDSLLSGTASIEKIAEALDNGELNKQAEPDNKKGSGASDAAETLATGAAVAGGASYLSNKKSTKAVRKFQKHEESKLHNRVGKAIGKGSKTVGKLARKAGRKLTLRDLKGEKLLENARNASDSAKRTGKLGLGMAAGAVGLKAYSDYQKGQEKTASEENIRGEIANEVTREATPEGGARKRGKEGALVGALAGFAHGASKKGGLTSPKARMLKGAWHGTAGAVWGGGAAGAATYAKKKVMPDTAEDMQRSFEKKLEKRAGLAHIGDVSLVSDMSGIYDKEANITAVAKTVARKSVKKKSFIDRPIDMTTKPVKAAKSTADDATVFHSSSGKSTSLKDAVKGHDVAVAGIKNNSNWQKSYINNGAAFTRSARKFGAPFGKDSFLNKKVF